LLEAEEVTERGERGRAGLLDGDFAPEEGHDGAWEATCGRGARRRLGGRTGVV